MKEKSDSDFFLLFSLIICKLNKIVLLLQSKGEMRSVDRCHPGPFTPLSKHV